MLVAILQVVEIANEHGDCKGRNTFL